MAGITSAWRTFWHTMTSNDRHASHDSPFRTGAHVPLNQSRHAPLTSVASATDSRVDLSSPYGDEPQQGFSTMGNGQGHGQPQHNNPNNGRNTPTSPYSPGLRSSLAFQRRTSHEKSSFEAGEIQMQSFQEGLPPPPPVAHSWKKIDRWTEDNYYELWDQLGEGATHNDLNELEHELDCSLPIEVRESLACHDGQERGGRPTGIIFGCMLLDCEEIVQEWRNWRVVNEEFLQQHPATGGSASYSATSPVPTINGIRPGNSRRPSVASSSKDLSPAPSASTAGGGANPLWRQELAEKQDSQPPKAVQRAYAHAGWIPLARDWGGNLIAVDLAPGPAGKWGQIILFGRDFDCKYVVARSWAAFLANVADDLTTGDKAFVDEETQELKLREFRKVGVEPAYMDILRWRMDQKYGRRQAAANGGVNGNNTNRRNGKLAVNGGSANAGPNGVLAHGSPRGSPYGSPTEERGRSPNRFPPLSGSSSNIVSNGNGATSPRATMISSPLSRVTTEEIATPRPMYPVSSATLERGSAAAAAVPAGNTTGANGNATGVGSRASVGVHPGANATAIAASKPEKLVEAPTPIVLQDESRDAALDAALNGTTRGGDEQDSKNAGRVSLVAGGEQVKGGSSAVVTGLGVDGVDELRDVAI